MVDRSRYNGGPHNVASWLGSWPKGLDTDLFVELIPFPETRDYVERVSGFYAEALARYGPEGAVVTIPPVARDAHPDGIDF